MIMWVTIQLLGSDDEARVSGSKKKPTAKSAEGFARDVMRDLRLKRGDGVEIYSVADEVELCRLVKA